MWPIVIMCRTQRAPRALLCCACSSLHVGAAEPQLMLWQQRSGASDLQVIFWFYGVQAHTSSQARSACIRS